jgi:transcriptional regulator GlxA family with amidase domain
VETNFGSQSRALIALSHGFSDVSRFSRTFRAAFGQSPRMLKRRVEP